MRYYALGRIFGFVLFLLVAGAFWAYRAVDDWLSFERTTATVTAVGETCRPIAYDSALEKDIESHPTWGNERWGDCLAASRYASLRPGVRVERARRVGVRYISPADDFEHFGSLQLRQNAGPRPQVGRPLEIMASNRDAPSIQPL